MKKKLPVQELTQTAFAPFGDVIEKYTTHNKEHCFEINNGYATRHHHLATAHTTAPKTGDDAGQVGINIFSAKPRTIPFELSVMERHPWGTQCFMPLNQEPYLVVVAKAGHAPKTMDNLVCFYAQAHQGVQYGVGVWHHPLLALNKSCDFLVVDRIGGDGHNCDEITIDDWHVQIDL